MGIEETFYFAAGAVSGFMAGCAVEHPLHEKMLHCENPDKILESRTLEHIPGFKYVRGKVRNFFKGAARGHHLIHHPEYDPDKHYFADKSNEEAVTHFSKKDVGVIALGSAGIGIAFNQALCLDQSFSCTSKDMAFTAGFFSGAMGYYGVYEGVHHLMHALGETRSKIGYRVGDLIQGGKSDGKLRLSVPLMEDLANAIEYNISKYSSRTSNYQAKFSYSDSLVSKLEEEIEHNRHSKLNPRVEVSSESIAGLLDNITLEFISEENKKISSISTAPYIKRKASRFIGRQIRKFPVFRKMGWHHYMHHIADHTNLNVVLPLMDVIRGTKVNSSRERLESNKALWHLPNPLERFAY